MLASFDNLCAQPGIIADSEDFANIESRKPVPAYVGKPGRYLR